MPRHCEYRELPDGTKMFLCHSGPLQKPAPCFVCGKTSIALCDYPVTRGAPPSGNISNDHLSVQATCDRPMCVDHTHKMFGKPNEDYCLEHYRIIKEGGK